MAGLANLWLGVAEVFHQVFQKFRSDVVLNLPGIKIDDL